MGITIIIVIIFCLVIFMGKSSTFFVNCTEKMPLKNVACRKNIYKVGIMYLFPDFLYSLFCFITCLAMKECSVVCLNILFIFSTWIFFTINIYKYFISMAIFTNVHF